LRDTIGDVDNSDELAALKANSAINFVENFKVPVLLIAGENDTRVHFSQSRDFYEAMKSANKDVQYILLDKGTHFIDTAAHRETTFSAIDKFIVGYLGE
jgi:dipeptidyl aminopeptidase/acylaminoacyl peptidase